MPFKSQAQARLFYAIANGNAQKKGLSKGTAKKFIKDTDHQEISKLPKLSKLLNKK